MSNNDSLLLRPPSKLELLFKERIGSQRSEFFPLRAVSNGMINHLFKLLISKSEGFPDPIFRHFQVS